MRKLVLSLMFLMQAITCSEIKREKSNLLFNACDGKFGSSIKGFIALLRSSTAELDARDKEGDTPLMYAARYNSCKLFERIMYWRKNDINVNSRQFLEWNKTALHIVAELDNPKRAQLLLDAGAEVDPISSFYDTTPLHAALLKSPELVKILVNRGADVMHKSMLHNKLPLHILAHYVGCGIDDHAIEKAQILLKAGAQINALTCNDNQCVSPLFLVRKYSCRQTYDIEQQKKAFDKFLVLQGAEAICQPCELKK